MMYDLALQCGHTVPGTRQAGSLEYCHHCRALRLVLRQLPSAYTVYAVPGERVVDLDPNNSGVWAVYQVTMIATGYPSKEAAIAAAQEACQ